MNVKKLLNSLVLVFLLVLGVLCLPPVRTQMEKAFYPCKYSALVEQYAAEYDLDPLLVRTISSPSATASACLLTSPLLTIPLGPAPSSR